MLVGLTYDLRSAWLAEGFGEEETAEFDRDDTVDAIENALRVLGHETVRIGHVRDLVAALARGERWDLVFNICEGLRGAARESQVPCLLDAWSIPYTFSDAGVLALTLNKAWTKAVLSEVVPVTAHEVITRADQLQRVHLPLPLFAKPVSEGTGKGVNAASVIRDLAGLLPHCRDLLLNFGQPVLLETYLPGREFTVSIIGTGNKSNVLGTFEIILRDAAEPDVYGYVNKEECEERVEYRRVEANCDAVVTETEALALAAWRLLGCRDGGRVDFRCDRNGKPYFLEVNPLAGLNPVHSDLPMMATAVGLNYVDLIGAIVDSAVERVVPRGAARVA